ncbi:MAG: Stk1 family PASTA domain-containing Ser/Thr kinase [Bacillota bacterium]|nr:Stk1 family PASTA domain-containing Ser/Thr kinase [Bacillota bacterium]
MIGKVLAGRYELIEKIAEGGMARVYRGRDQLLKRTVAVKILKDQMTGDAAFIRRFEREAQSAAALSHPHIVNIYDVGVEEGTYYMVMEFVDGINLKEYIREKGRLSISEALQITHQIAEALEQAHAAGVVHRDIKPQNILFSNEGKVKVTDFGIAIAGDGVTVTVGDEIIGSVQYISPEQARGELAGKQSDLYSLGIVLYEMLTGKVPFSGESPVAVAMKHIQEHIVPPRRLVNDIPETVEQIILKAVAKDSAERYTSAAELLEDLEYAAQKGSSKSGPVRRLFKNNTEDDDDATVLRPIKSSSGNYNGMLKPKRSYRWLIYLGVVILIGLLLAGAGYLLASYVFIPEVAIPEVKDMTQSDAAQVLRDVGLVPAEEIFYIYDDLIQVGNVVKTEPPEGRVVRKGRAVDLFVSKGPEFISTPDLFGRTELEARVILTDLELVMRVEREYNEEIPEGLIFRQVPGESFRISRGEEVVVFVSQGRGPFIIADLVGYSEEGAIAYLEENGLRPRVRYRFSIGAVGHVIEQLPQGGEEVIPGQTVELIVGE